MKFLIAGLGNIGSEYQNTRHNVGFEVADALARAFAVSFAEVKFGAMARAKYKGRTALLLKPNTFMNLSGKAVQYWLQHEKIALDHLLVITDDLALPFGRQRLRMQGSDGGHNGLKSINALLRTQAYPRLRMGIGSDFAAGRQIDHVLGGWSEAEAEALPQRLQVAVETVQAFLSIGPALTMSTFNNK